MFWNEVVGVAFAALVVFVVIAAMTSGAVAQRRGRSGGWPALLCLLSGFLGAVVSAVFSHPTGAVIGMYLIPIAAVLWSFTAPGGADVAAKKGHFGQWRKCPYCAEGIRREAVRCKHCACTVEPMPERRYVKPEQRRAQRRQQPASRD